MQSKEFLIGELLSELNVVSIKMMELLEKEQIDQEFEQCCTTRGQQVNVLIDLSRQLSVSLEDFFKNHPMINKKIQEACEFQELLESKILEIRKNLLTQSKQQQEIANQVKKVAHYGLSDLR